jgi:hypothetical protein
MATTTNYAWTTPDNSGLVKNGAQDIRTLGSSVDTSLWNVGFGQAGKNKIINGNFGIWQRGTSFTVTTATFSADRFFHNRDGNGTVTASQQTFTPGTAPVAGYEGQYFLQLATSSVGTSTYTQTFQYIEDVRTFAGQTITVSFWAKLSAGTIGSSYFRFNQNFGSGGSATIQGSSNTFTPTGSWQRFSATISVPSVSGKTIGSGSYFSLEIVVPFSATNTMQFWGVQAEAGSVATAFQTATGTIQGELAACQRYYQRWTGLSTGGSSFGFQGFAGSTTLAVFSIVFPVQMRVAPTAMDFSNLAFYNYRTGVNSTGGSFVQWTGFPGNSELRYTHGSAIYTINDFVSMTSNASAATYLGFSAEL